MVKINSSELRNASFFFYFFFVDADSSLDTYTSPLEIEKASPVFIFNFVLQFISCRIFFLFFSFSFNLYPLFLNSNFQQQAVIWKLKCPGT